MKKLIRANDLVDKYDIDLSLFEEELIKLAELTTQNVKYNINQNNTKFEELANFVNLLFNDFIRFYLFNENGNGLRKNLTKLIKLIEEIQRDILLTQIGREENGFIK